MMMSSIVKGKRLRVDQRRREPVEGTTVILMQMMRVAGREGKKRGGEMNRLMRRMIVDDSIERVGRKGGEGKASNIQMIWMDLRNAPEGIGGRAGEKDRSLLMLAARMILIQEVEEAKYNLERGAGNTATNEISFSLGVRNRAMYSYCCVVLSSVIVKF
ncbi:hypothetical protein ACET3Z_025374 [Daucus carota]